MQMILFISRPYTTQIFKTDFIILNIQYQFYNFQPSYSTAFYVSSLDFQCKIGAFSYFWGVGGGGLFA